MELRDIVFEKLIDKMMTEELMTKTEFLEKDNMNRMQFLEAQVKLREEMRNDFREYRNWTIGTILAITSLIASLVLGIIYH